MTDIEQIKRSNEDALKREAKARAYDRENLGEAYMRIQDRKFIRHMRRAYPGSIYKDIGK